MSRTGQWLIRNRVLVALLFLAGVTSVLWAVANPPMGSPDEPHHFGYIQYLSREHSLPLGGHTFHYADTIRFINRVNIITDPHKEIPNDAAYHPPLYYMLMLPAYEATVDSSIATQVYAIRIFGSLIFITLIGVSYMLAREVFPRAAYLQIGVPLLMIFHPQLNYISASVMNDSLLVLLFTWLLYNLIVFAKGDLSYRRAFFIGVATGLGMLVKSSFFIAYPVILLVLAGLMVTGRGYRLRLIKTMGLAAGLSIIICGWFYVRNFIYFGALQPHTWQDVYGTTSVVTLWTATKFRADLISSFLGNFSALRLPFPDSVLYWFRRIMEISGVLLVVSLALGWRRPSWRAIKPWVAALFAVIFVLFLVAVSYFEVTAGGSQGRYLFPAIFPFWALVLVGLVGWMPTRWRPRATAVVVAFAAVFSTWALLVEFLPRVML